MAITSAVFDNVTNILDVTAQLNILSEGLLVGLIVITLFMVAFVSFNSNNASPRASLIGASFLSAVGCLFLAGAGLLADDKLMYVAFILAGVGIWLSVTMRE